MQNFSNTYTSQCLECNSKWQTSPTPALHPKVSGNILPLSLCNIKLDRHLCQKGLDLLYSLVLRKILSAFWKEMVWGRFWGKTVQSYQIMLRTPVFEAIRNQTESEGSYSPKLACVSISEDSELHNKQRFCCLGLRGLQLFHFWGKRSNTFWFCPYQTCLNPNTLV